MNDGKFSDHQTKTVLEHPDVLKTVGLRNIFLEVLSWMYFPSSGQEIQRNATKEILHNICFNGIKEELAKELGNGCSVKSFNKHLSSHLGLSLDLATDWIKLPFTEYGFREHKRACFKDHQRVLVLLMECLEQGDGNFTKVFKTLKMDHVLNSPNKHETILKTLGCQDFFRESYLDFKSVTPFILAFYTVGALGKIIEDDIMIFLKWCLFYQEKLLALRIPSVREDRSYRLRSEWLPPVDLEKHVELSDEERETFDRQRIALWKKIKSTISREKSKG